LSTAQGEGDGFHDVIEDVVRREFGQMQREFEAARAKNEADVDRSVAEAETLRTALRFQLAQLRGKADKDIAEFRSATAEMQDAHKRVTQRMEMNGKKELSAIIDRGNEKYKISHPWCSTARSIE
jgi:ElaB/YqjD/DUF883 family membrane-anchored ribosome-binding protein